MVACPGRLPHSFTTCRLSSASGSTDSWAVTGTGTPQASPGALSTCGSGSPGGVVRLRRRGLTAGSSGPTPRPSRSPPPSSAHGTPWAGGAKCSRKPGRAGCSWPTRPPPSSAHRRRRARASPAPPPTTIESVPVLPARRRGRGPASAPCCCGEPPRRGPGHVVAPGSPAAATPPDAEMTRRLRRYDDVLTAVAAARPAWAGVVSVDDLVCPRHAAAMIDGCSCATTRRRSPRLRPPARARAGSTSAERAHASTTSGMIIGRRR